MDLNSAYDKVIAEVKPQSLDEAANILVMLYKANQKITPAAENIPPVAKLLPKVADSPAVVVETTTKICSKCGEELDKTEFPTFTRKGKKELRNMCRPCYNHYAAETNRKWKKNHDDFIKRLHTPETKVCPRCGDALTLDHYYMVLNKTVGKTYPSAYCKPCMAKHVDEWKSKKKKEEAKFKESQIKVVEDSVNMQTRTKIRSLYWNQNRGVDAIASITKLPYDTVMSVIFDNPTAV